MPKQQQEGSSLREKPLRRVPIIFRLNCATVTFRACAKNETLCEKEKVLFEGAARVEEYFSKDR
jgi:hypothetical protein